MLGKHAAGFKTKCQLHQDEDAEEAEFAQQAEKDILKWARKAVKYETLAASCVAQMVYAVHRVGTFVYDANASKDGFLWYDRQHDRSCVFKHLQHGPVLSIPHVVSCSHDGITYLRGQPAESHAEGLVEHHKIKRAFKEVEEMHAAIQQVSTCTRVQCIRSFAWIVLACLPYGSSSNP